MRSSRWILGLAAFGLLFGAPVAVADEPEAGGDVQEQLWLMQQKLKRMEDQLAATNRQLSDAQSQLRSRGAAPADGGPDLPGFFDRLEFSGWMSGEYFYNFNDPDGEFLDTPNNAGGLILPFSEDANSFQFGQLWFEIEHPVSPEHRAGFRADIVMGDDADELNDGGDTNESGGDDDFHVYQAYVQYLAPVAVGDGLHLKFGKFGTLIGAETVHDHPDYNFNITRSNVFNLLQPITHVGLLASTNFEGGFDMSAGVVNATRGGGGGGSGLDVDFNNNKALTGHIGWAGEMAGISINGIWGSNDFGDEEADELILDLILSLDPTDDFSTYVNFDYLTNDGDSRSKGQAYGVSWAGKYQLNEKLSQALRVDYVDDDGGIFSPANGDVHIWTVTATTAYMLTNNLTLRAEVRYDDIEAEFGDSIVGNNFKRNDFFFSDSGTTEGNQILVGAQLVYAF